MRKLVAAGVISLAALGGTAGVLHASPLSALASRFMPHTAKDGQVVLAQSNETGRIGQLEEELRTLNGRIEELSYQLLQMQEQLRKTQEDNEYRFQDLEGGKGTSQKSGSLTKPADSGSVTDLSTRSGQPADEAAGDDVAAAIGSANGGSNDGLGAPPQQLGSVRFDEKGNVIGAETSPDLNESASISKEVMPGDDSGLPAASSGTASGSLDNPDDIYKAAYGHVLSGDYQLAEKEFRDYLDIYPKGEKAADASFWMGEAQYSQGNFNEAAKTFLNAHQTFAQSKKAPEMLLKLGMSLAALDNTETACATLREVGKRYPNASKAVKTKVNSEQSRLSC
ncbi:tol-pal system protein YbgF [Sinorhizobium sp. BG8]|uniref:tol-pal system protein YbgF n=1 Tax=Sinorhizobium sp. BG8 TaxID=2613773 RepID=UPI00193EB495|nr:tol-pal system protein YbgF [Sinorhizobium sp. BG8]QRM56584.1 tol-pal system protein YbgF [Sinorhizobium sp. BG8]